MAAPKGAAFYELKAILINILRIKRRVLFINSPLFEGFISAKFTNNFCEKQRFTM
jgi:hypothetical protein